jgi:ribosomal protein L12E/L44/L45/RPP1/RPP2
MRWEDKILKILEGAEVPYNPQHWELMQNELKHQDFSSALKNKFDGSSMVPPAGAWEAFEQKLEASQSSPDAFEQAVQEKFASAEVKSNPSLWDNISAGISESKLTAFEKATRSAFEGAKVTYNHKHWLAFAKAYYQRIWGWKMWSGIAASLIGLLSVAGVLYFGSNKNDTAIKDSASDIKSTKKSNQKESVEFNAHEFHKLYINDDGQSIPEPAIEEIGSVNDLNSKEEANQVTNFGSSNMNNHEQGSISPFNGQANVESGNESHLNQQSGINENMITPAQVEKENKEVSIANASIIETSINKDLIRFTNLPVLFENNKFDPLKIESLGLHLGYLTHLGNHRGPQSIGMFQSNYAQVSFCNDWEKVFKQDELQQFQFIYPSIYQATYEGTNEQGTFSWGGQVQTQKKKYWTERQLGGQIAYRKQLAEGQFSLGVGARYSYSFIHDESLSLREQAALSSNVTIGELNREQILADQRMFGQFGLGYYHKYGFVSYDAQTTEVWSNDNIESIHARQRFQGGINFSLTKGLEQSVWLGNTRTIHDTNIQELGLSTTFIEHVALNLIYQSNDVFISELIGKYKGLNAFIIWQSSTKKVDQKYSDFSVLDGQVKGGVRWNW